MAFMKFSKEKAKEADKGFGLIADGSYELLITESEYRPKGKNVNTPNINLTLTIRSDVDQDYKGRKVFHPFYISEKSDEHRENSLNMIMAFLDKVGVPDGQEFDTPQEIAAFLTAKVVKGQVYTDTYNGKESNKIKYFNPSDLFGEKVDVEAATGKKGLKKADDSAPDTRIDEDPFANDGKTIDISDDDLPF